MTTFSESLKKKAELLRSIENDNDVQLLTQAIYTILKGAEDGTTGPVQVTGSSVNSIDTGSSGTDQELLSVVGKVDFEATSSEDLVGTVSTTFTQNGDGTETVRLSINHIHRSCNMGVVSEVSGSSATIKLYPDGESGGYSSEAVTVSGAGTLSAGDYVTVFGRAVWKFSQVQQVDGNDNITSSGTSIEEVSKSFWCYVNA